MPKIISIHSFRGGTGKSNTTANLAALLAADQKRVGVIDTDIQSPGIHVLFGIFVVYGFSGYGVFVWKKIKGRPVSVISTSTDEPDEEGLHR